MLLVRCTATMRTMAMVAIGILISGCSKPDANDRTSVFATPATRAELLAEAQSNYTYGAGRASLAVDDTRLGGPGGTLPSLTIASVTRMNSTGRAPGSRFIGRLTSGGAYAPLGIAPGLNYVWRDSLGLEPERARTLMIPADTAYPMFWLQHDSDRTPLYAGTSAMPRLVQSSVAYGLCDSGCSGGHCVVKMTRRVYAAASDTTVIVAP